MAHDGADRWTAVVRPHGLRIATARWRSMGRRARNLTPLPGDVDFTVGAALVMPCLGPRGMGCLSTPSSRGAESPRCTAAAGRSRFDGEPVRHVRRRLSHRAPGARRRPSEGSRLRAPHRNRRTSIRAPCEDVGAVDLEFSMASAATSGSGMGPDSCRRTLVTVTGPDRGAALGRPDIRLRRRTRSRPI